MQSALRSSLYRYEYLCFVLRIVWYPYPFPSSSCSLEKNMFFILLKCHKHLLSSVSKWDGRLTYLKTVIFSDAAKTPNGKSTASSSRKECNTIISLKIHTLKASVWSKDNIECFWKIYSMVLFFNVVFERGIACINDYLIYLFEFYSPLRSPKRSSRFMNAIYFSLVDSGSNRSLFYYHHDALNE